MIKHVGRHNNRKIVVVYREIPGEDHMCLVTYSDSLPSIIHDELMKTIEGAVAQNTTDVADVLFRTMLADGRGLLEAIHTGGYMKKVPTNQVIMTPSAANNIRLDELNSLLNEMAKGEEAIARLADLDSQRGMNSGNRKNKVIEGREVGVPPNTKAGPVTVPDPMGVLSDADLATQRRTQAADMKKQAEQLIAEATRLEKEANELSPSNVRKTKKASTTKKQTA